MAGFKVFTEARRDASDKYHQLKMVVLTQIFDGGWV